jgi:hypothetical protein
MVGAEVRLFTPTSALSLEASVLANQFYRHVDRVVDLTFVRALVRDRNATGLGRPSVDHRLRARSIPVVCETCRIATTSHSVAAGHSALWRRMAIHTEPGARDCRV